eukprot:COSAG03_NODE_6652_length_1024_cov_49.861622_1_plen_160_part_10
MGLLDAAVCAVLSACSNGKAVWPEKRLPFRISVDHPNLGEFGRMQPLVRGSARHRRLGYPEGVLTVRHGKLHRQQRPLWSCSARWHFRLFSPLFAFSGPSGSSDPNGRISRSAPSRKAKTRREGPFDPFKGCGKYGLAAWSGTRDLGNKVTKNRVWNRTS